MKEKRKRTQATASQLTPHPSPTPPTPQTQKKPSILDGFVLVPAGQKQRPGRRAEGDICISLSRSNMKLSTELNEALGKPPFFELLVNESTGQAVFIPRKTGASGFPISRNQGRKNGSKATPKDRRGKPKSIQLKNPACMKAIREQVLLHCDKAAQYFGSDDDFLPGAYISLAGKREDFPDPRDKTGRKTVAGVLFELTSAEFYQMSQEHLDRLRNGQSTKAGAEATGWTVVEGNGDRETKRQTQQEQRERSRQAKQARQAKQVSGK